VQLHFTFFTTAAVCAGLYIYIYMLKMLKKQQPFNIKFVLFYIFILFYTVGDLALTNQSPKAEKKKE